MTVRLAPILALDSASPVVSVAVGTAGAVAAQRTIELRRSAELLLSAMAEILAEAGCALGDLGGIVALQGPGSFTGLRIGLGTVLGLHQALDLPATAVPTLPVLAAAAADSEQEVVAAVDALRGEWYVQRFPGGGDPAGPAGLRPGRALAALGPCRLVGFGVETLAAEPWWTGSGVELVPPPPLAPVALEYAHQQGVDWDPARLTAPIYFRPPAVTKGPKGPSGG